MEGKVFKCAYSLVPHRRKVGIVKGLEKSQTLISGGGNKWGGLNKWGCWKMTKNVIERQWFLVTNLYQSYTAKSIE